MRGGTFTDAKGVTREKGNNKLSYGEVTLSTIEGRGNINAVVHVSRVARSLTLSPPPPLPRPPRCTSAQEGPARPPRAPERWRGAGMGGSVGKGRGVEHCGAMLLRVKRWCEYRKPYHPPLEPPSHLDGLRS